MDRVDFIGKYNHEDIGLFNGGVPPLIPKLTMQQLVQDIADTFAVSLDASAKEYNDITALLANTDLGLRRFALVDDASADPAVNEGWALYLLIVSDPTDLGNYVLISKQYVSSGASVLIDAAFDATGDVFKSSGGTGPGGAIRMGNYYIVGIGTDDHPVGTICTAKENDPGQDTAKWHRNYGGE